MLAEALTVIEAQLNLSDVANAVYGLGKLGHDCSKSVVRLLHRQLLQYLPMMEAPQVAYVTWGVAKLHGVGFKLKSKLGTAILDRVQATVDEMHAQSIGLVSWGLAALVKSEVRHFPAQFPPF